MPDNINMELEQEVADFYRSIGINQGPGNIQYRLVLKVLEKKTETVSPSFQIYECLRTSSQIREALAVK